MKPLMLTLLLVSSCQPYNEPSPDHYQDQVSHEIFKLPYQDSAFLILRARLEDHYQAHVPNLLQHDWDDNVLAVWWVDDQLCPYQLERNAIITCKNIDCPKRCLAGQTWGCAEIYVATNRKDPTRVCGTALAHEYGHCLRPLFLDGADGQHKDDEFWGVVQTTNREFCERGW